MTLESREVRYGDGSSSGFLGALEQNLINGMHCLSTIESRVVADGEDGDGLSSRLPGVLEQNE